ncbi:type I secretion system permease/ATPase [Reyranella sp.]|uniref:type I secretion system permease/ATPase n=1 Tax=Reyranella sp. TaxID=1929291 RepID=UPI003BA96BE8
MTVIDTAQRGPAASSPLARALRASRTSLAAVGLFTGVINVLMLTGSLFMLQVYDRVLPSRSVPTLIALIAVVAGLYAVQGGLDMIRGRMLVRLGRSLDEQLNLIAYEGVVRQPLKGPRRGDGLQAIRDLDQIRSFLSGTGPAALFDLPWMPLYLGICFAFHVYIGLAALAGALLLVALTLVTELLTRNPARASSGFGASRLSLAEASRRNAEVLKAMGMTRRLGARWQASNDRYMDAQQRTADIAGGLGAATRVLRMLLQSCVLGVGAYLVINQEATAGIIIASSILTSRALAPVELAIANWKSFQSARQSWRRLSEVTAGGSDEAPMALPVPVDGLAVEALTVCPPGSPRPAVLDVSFQLKAGQGLGIIGSSAAGKTSLARALVGVWSPVRGKVRIDGAAIEQWAPDALGAHIGYLPQDVELFDGTVAENIARFEPGYEPGRVVAAARSAGVHDLILRLPEGYETRIGEQGGALSAGQRQRIALARALYGEPFLVVLDEPNSNLDREGEQALAQAILEVRNRKGIVVVIAHRPAALHNLDLVLAMAGGRLQAFGPRDEVLGDVLQPHRLVPRRMRQVAGAKGAA